MREISDGDAPRESLIVQLQVNREALSRLVGSTSVQRPDMSHRESAPRDEHRPANGGVVERKHSDAHTPPPPSLAQQVEPTQRRSSGFKAINASSETVSTTAEPASVPVAAPAPTHTLPPLSSIQAPSGPLQQTPLSRRSSAANPTPLRIVPLEKSVAPEGSQNPPSSSEISNQPHPPVQSLTAPTGPFRDQGHGHHAFRVHRPFVA